MGEKITRGNTANNPMKANRVGEPVRSKTHTPKAKLVNPDPIKETT